MTRSFFKQNTLILIFAATSMAHLAVLLVKTAQDEYRKSLAPVQLQAFNMTNSAVFKSGTPGLAAPQPKAAPTLVRSPEKATVAAPKEMVPAETVAAAPTENVGTAGSGGVVAGISAAGAMAKGDLQQIYLSELKARLDQNKQYPLQARRLGQTGSVEVTFTVTPEGHIQNARVTRPSPFQRLNDSALTTVESLKKFRPLPKDISEAGPLLVTLPIRYSLN